MTYHRISPTCEMFRNMLRFHGEELLVLSPTPKDRSPSAARDCVFNIFAATLQICKLFLHPQPEDAPCRGHRDPLIMVCTPKDSLTTDRKRFASFHNKIPGHNKPASSLPRNRLKLSPASPYPCANPWLMAGSETEELTGGVKCLLYLVLLFFQQHAGYRSS
jgi:hypothetical protein